jgi:hypothetical protein
VQVGFVKYEFGTVIFDASDVRDVPHPAVCRCADGNGTHDGHGALGFLALGLGQPVRRITSVDAIEVGTHTSGVPRALSNITTVVVDGKRVSYEADLATVGRYLDGFARLIASAFATRFAGLRASDENEATLTVATEGKVPADLVRELLRAFRARGFECPESARGV